MKRIRIENGTIIDFPITELNRINDLIDEFEKEQIKFEKAKVEFEEVKNQIIGFKANNEVFWAKTSYQHFYDEHDRISFREISFKYIPSDGTIVSTLKNQGIDEFVVILKKLSLFKLFMFIKNY